MAITIAASPVVLDGELLARARTVALPTIGHYLEEGFVDPGIRRLVGSGLIVGRAVTVRTTPTDSTNLHHVVGHIESGDVVVIDTGGDHRHAPLGEVVVEALVAGGAAGVVVDGVCTDIEELTALGLPIYARGTSPLTTKLEASGLGSIYAPISCGGQTVRSGDVVLADANGVLIVSADVLARVLPVALEDDAEEPELIDQVRSGGRLGELTGASDVVRKHGVPVS
ncbi:MAG: hypothetical protein QM673_15605 [Gordonia sp. (in: high G+C Gram-positive bacteria)]